MHILGTFMLRWKSHPVQHMQEKNLCSCKRIYWFLLKLPEVISSFSVIYSRQGHIQV